MKQMRIKVNKTLMSTHFAEQMIIYLRSFAIFIYYINKLQIVNLINTEKKKLKIQLKSIIKFKLTMTAYKEGVEHHKDQDYQKTQKQEC